ncbi:Ankyrin repeat, PH and SEC7 domain containing protein secG-like [Phytophthora cinnamomi]|uniref:Ankyrin repeat, PH and SEC7 domain containing protein secG-like n=1 Tax=Phytophthora cinnamomi TaxID=4785 RepID=UPI003559A11A|nr:Ankyrin repeat, PH and SEC7 domain containing protein secG-like [Phytophthora cinnamomi]
MSAQPDREWIEARRRILVGSILAPSDKDQFIEASFATHFGRNVPEPGFWAAFEQACSFAAEGILWHTPRQLMISYSLPQQVNGKDARGETMMTLAATFGRAKVVSILCQIKGDPRIENAKGWSTVHVAAAYNHVNVMEALLNLGVSMNEKDSRLGYTPLHLAASVDNVEVLRVLHDSKQADFWKKAKNGFSVLHVASAHGSYKCVEFLSETFPDMKFHEESVLKESPAHKAAKHLHPHVYQHLASLGARDDLENVEDDTARDISLFNNRYNF